MTTQQRITGALFIDMGRQLKNGTWAQHPRAKYECMRCCTTEGPAVGAAAVTAFVATIRATHQQTHHTHQQGAQAA